MKIIILSLSLALVLFSSCSHENLIKQAHISGNCSEKIREIVPPPGQRIMDFSRQVATGSVSIAIAGVGAATDAIVIVLTSPVTKISLCVTAIAIAASGESIDLGFCQYAGEPGLNPKLAQKALDHTKSWRCPNLDYISQGLRKVAACYSQGKENEKAKLQLESILNNKTISECISTEEIDRIKIEMAQL